MKLLQALSSAGRMELLRVLGAARRPLSFPEMHQRAHQQNSTSFFALKTLLRDGLVGKTPARRPASYELIRDNPLAAALLVATALLAEIERQYLRPIFIENFENGLGMVNDSSSPLLRAALVEVANELNRSRVPWALTGSFAANAYTAAPQVCRHFEVAVLDSRAGKEIGRRIRSAAGRTRSRALPREMVLVHLVPANLCPLLRRAEKNRFLIGSASVRLLTPEDFILERLVRLSGTADDRPFEIEVLTRVFDDCSSLNIQVVVNRLEDLGAVRPDAIFRELPPRIRLALGHRAKCGRKRKKSSDPADSCE